MSSRADANRPVLFCRLVVLRSFCTSIGPSLIPRAVSGKQNAPHIRSTTGKLMSHPSARTSNALAKAISLSLVLSSIVPIAHATQPDVDDADEAPSNSTVGD